MNALVNSRQFILNYLKKHKKITVVDMIKIQNQIKIRPAEQIKILRQLVSEVKASENSTSSELIFELPDPNEVRTEQILSAGLQQKIENIREHLLLYIHLREGYYNELDVFVEYGIPIEAQEKILDYFMKKEIIEEYRSGYKIIKKAN